MLGKKLANLVHHLRTAAGPTVEHSDAEALAQFVDRQDEAAFRLLLERHAPMVRAVCRHVLKTDHDAEDAFQAAFLVLARKAASIQRRHDLAAWLYRVAYRLALALRARIARRQLLERQAPVKPDQLPPDHELADDEQRATLLAEVDGLPECYRAALVLCTLEGKGTDEAAATLGWSEGAVRARLWRGRKLLMSRLERRQVKVSAGAVGALLLVRDPVSAAQLDQLSRAAMLFAGGGLPSGLVSEQASLLACETLARATRKLWTGVLAASVLLVAASAGMTYYLADVPEPSVQSTDDESVALRAQEPEPPATDRHGDPLPPQAVARLGSQRLRHQGALRAVAFSPDGKILASGGEIDESVRLWDMSSGKLIGQLQRKDFWTNQLAFSYSGKKLAACGFHGPLVLWDVQRGQELAVTEKVDSPYVGVIFCNESLLATAHWDHTIRLWDDKGQAVAKLDAHNSEITDLAGHGSLLATVAKDGELRLWDAGTKKRLATLETPVDPRSVSFSSDGKLVLVAAAKAAALYDVSTQKEVQRFVGKEDKDRVCVFAAAISPDGKTVATGGADAIHLWDRQGGQQTGKIPWKCPHHLVFTPDSKSLVATEYSDHAVQIWDVATRKDHFDLPGHSGLVTSVSFAPDGKRILSRGIGNHLFIWDASSGAALSDQFLPRAENLGFNIHASQHRTVAAYAPDGKLYACGRDDSSIRVYDAASGKEKWLLLGHESSVNGVAFSPRHEVLVSAGEEGKIRVWDLKTGKQVRTLTGHTLGVECLALSRDGRLLASGANGEVQVADAASPMGRTERDGTVRLWDMDAGKELLRLEVGETIQSVRFTPDGTLVAAALDDRICLWEVASGKKVREWFWDEEDRVAFSASVLDFSPDGRLLVYNNRSCIRFRDVATFEEAGKIDTGSNTSTALAFSPDGRRLASGHRDTTILVWQLTSIAPKALAADLEDSELDDCWRELASDDPLRAHRAGWKLSGARVSADFLSKRIKPVRPAERKDVLPLLRDLDSEDGKLRGQALAKLQALGPVARPIVEETLAQDSSLEVRRRLEKLCADWDTHLVSTPETLRTLRAIAVLERIGSPQTDRVLKMLAEGLKGARETQAALLALARLERTRAR